MAIVYEIIQLRRGTAAQWWTANPLLSVGEIGFEQDTMKFKFGDGVTFWNDLGYSPATVQFKRYTLHDWLTNNPILAEGELGYETDTGKFKIGDGVTAYAGLSYYSSGTSGGSSVGLPVVQPLRCMIAGVAAASAKQYEFVLGSEFAGGKTLTKVRLNSDVAPVGANLIVDINQNGTSIWAATPANRVQVAAGANAGTQTSFDITIFYEGDVITVDVDQVGSGTPGGDALSLVMDFDWGNAAGSTFLGFRAGGDQSWTSTTSVTVQGMAIEINGFIYTLPAATVRTTTGLTASSWYYVFVQAPASGTVMGLSEITYSLTPPTYDQAKSGWYDATGDLRCIGVFKTDSSSHIEHYSIIGKVFLPVNPLTFLSTTSPAVAWTGINVGAPVLGRLVVFINGYSVSNNASAGKSGYIRSYGQSNNDPENIGGLNSSNSAGGVNYFPSLTVNVPSRPLLTDSNQEIEYYLETGYSLTTYRLNLLYFQLPGGF